MSVEIKRFKYECYFESVPSVLCRLIVRAANVNAFTDSE